MCAGLICLVPRTCTAHASMESSERFLGQVMDSQNNTEAAQPYLNCAGIYLHLQ